MKTPIILLCGGLFLSACGQKPAEQAQPTEPTKQAEAKKTPKKTDILRGADLVGYDGKALKKKVEKIQGAHEKHQEELQKAMPEE